MSFDTNECRILHDMYPWRNPDIATIARGYAQLAPHSGTNDDAKLRTSIERLLELAKKEKQRHLIADLESLAEAMDRERAA